MDPPLSLSLSFPPLSLLLSEDIYCAVVFVRSSSLRHETSLVPYFANYVIRHFTPSCAVEPVLDTLFYISMREPTPARGKREHLFKRTSEHLARLLCRKIDVFVMLSWRFDARSALFRQKLSSALSSAMLLGRHTVAFSFSIPRLRAEEASRFSQCS